MKIHSKKDILKKVAELWSEWEERHYEKMDVSVEVNATCIKLKLSSMYHAPGLTFKMLKGLAEFFETENINDDDKFSRSGCETCDYGSQYGFTLTIRPETTEEESKWKHIKNLSDSN